MRKRGGCGCALFPSPRLLLLPCGIPLPAFARYERPAEHHCRVRAAADLISACCSLSGCVMTASSLAPSDAFSLHVPSHRSRYCVGKAERKNSRKRAVVSSSARAKSASRLALLIGRGRSRLELSEERSVGLKLPASRPTKALWCCACRSREVNAAGDLVVEGHGRRSTPAAPLALRSPSVLRSSRR